jgi:NAD(P)-dependent dehydrogenase (short-subunit alcohol dehydrogenase family)
MACADQLNMRNSSTQCLWPHYPQVTGLQKNIEDIADLPAQRLDETFETSVDTLLWLRKAAVPLLSAGANIANTAAIQAYQPSESPLDDAPTKPSIVAFGKPFAKQIAPTGMGVNAVSPCPFRTPPQISRCQRRDLIQQFGSGVRMQRPGALAEGAPIHAILAPQVSSYDTGGVFGVTGGNPLR